MIEKKGRQNRQNRQGREYNIKRDRNKKVEKKDINNYNKFKDIV